jgi:NADH-quinone oxidoreductase subunit E
MNMSHAAPYSREAHKFDKVCAIIDRVGKNPSKLITILQAVQEEYRYLPSEVMTFIAVALGISPAKVFGVATFYGHFALEPKGKYIIRVCDGTACHVKGSNPLIEVLRQKLGLTAERKTTADMLFTLETVSCLGACGLAPVMLVNEEVYGQVTKEKVVAIIDSIKTQEGERA